MIIKSMARKDPTFWQLAQYIERNASGAPFTHNLLQTGADLSSVANAFEQNHSHLPKRKGGNGLYHEIIALSPQPHLTPNQQIKVLTDLAQRYCERRAPDQMAWGKVHLDTDYPHLHLMISANGKGSAKRHRLSRAQFAEIQRDVEGLALVQFPELTGRAVYNKAATARTTLKKTRSEGELERRTNRQSTKSRIAGELRNIFCQSDNTNLVANLGASGFTLSKRGSTHIITKQETGRRYRLTTLGLVGEFTAAIARETRSIARPDDERAQTLLRNRGRLEEQVQEHLQEFEDSHER